MGQIFLLFIGILWFSSAKPWTAFQSTLSHLNLPPSHLVPYLFSHPEIRGSCDSIDACPSQPLCWGYESGCDSQGTRVNFTTCPGPPDALYIGRMSKRDQEAKFWKHGDFGHVQEELKTLKVLCEPSELGDSSLSCSQNGRFCHAKKLLLDLRDIKHDTIQVSGQTRNGEPMFKEGQVIGKCLLKADLLHSWGQYALPNSLTHPKSWYGQFLRFYHTTDSPSFFPNQCDLVYEKPTLIVRWPANNGYNLYDHFIDFLNIYITQHINGSFSTDVSIIIWHTQDSYTDYFKEMWPVFSDHKIEPLGRYLGKKLCFSEVIFSVYNPLFFFWPLVAGCEGSALFRAFSEHVLHRLRVPRFQPLEGKVRVTYIVRHIKRRILNEGQIIAALKSVEKYSVQIANFTQDTPFVEHQLAITHNTDILVGLHGAGLTHMLFMPKWGAVVELYHCGYVLYSDYARLCGLRQFSWEKKDLIRNEQGEYPPLEIGREFTNYNNYHLDVDETLRLVEKAAEYVRTNPLYQEHIGNTEESQQLKHEL